MFKLLCIVVLLLAVPVCALAQCSGGLTVTKEVDVTAAPVGHEVTYTIEVYNESNCSMLLDFVVDSVVGDLSGFLHPELPPGASDVYEYAYTIESDDPDPLMNIVDAMYTDESGEQHFAVADAEVDVLHPGFTLTLECLGALPAPSTDAEFEVFVVNTGDVTLDFTFYCCPGQPGPTTLGPGESLTHVMLAPCSGGEACTDITATATLPPEYGIEYTLEDYAESCCPCEGAPVKEESWGVIKALYR